MNKFVITSHGWSASNWVAHALNLHPQVLCTHSARNVLADDPALQSDENLRKNLHSLHKGYVNRTERSLEDVYEEIAAMGDADWYGSVHVYRLRDLVMQQSLIDAGTKPIPVANVIRHPVDLVWSGYGQFKTLFGIDVNELYWTLNKTFRLGKDFVIDLGQRHNLNMGEFEQLGFVGACAVLEGLRKDFDAVQEVSSAPVFEYKGMYQMEKLTSDPSFVQKMLADVTHGSIQSDDAYRKAVSDTGIINRHKHDRQPLRGKERYDALTDWQREAFDHFMELFDLKDAYEAVGYDLSFLK